MEASRKPKRAGHFNGPACRGGVSGFGGLVFGAVCAWMKEKVMGTDLGLYLGRRARAIFSEYELGSHRKSWDTKKGLMPEHECLATFCRTEFERLTGIRLKPGEIRKVKEIRFVFEE